MSASELENAWLLYPGAEAVPVSDAFADSGPPRTLIVPDGTWPQTRRWLRREPGVAGLKKVKVVGESRLDTLRRAQDAQHLSTFEAVSHALRVCEGEQVHQALQQHFMRWQNLAQLSKRGGLGVNHTLEAASHQP